MNISTKLFLAVLVTAALFGNKVKAQTVTTTTNPWRLDVGVDGGFVTGDLKTLPAYTEVGATLRLQYKINDDFSLMLSSGYYNFSVPANLNTYTVLGGVTYVTSGIGQGVVPVKLGLKYFVIPQFYVDGEGGVGFETQYGDNKKIIVAPGIGWQSDGLDIGFRYENLMGQNSNYGIIGLHVAYGFGL